MTAAANATRAEARFGIGLALGAMLLSAACWGLATVMTKGLLAQIPPFTLLAIQLAASVAFLWAAAAATRTRVWLDRNAYRAAASGLLEPGLAYGLAMPGLALTTAANASIIFAVEPALVALVAWAFLGLRPSQRLVIAMLVAMTGVCLIALTDLSGLGAGDIRGDALVFLGTLFAAFYVVASSRLVTHIPPLPLAALQQSVGLGASLLMLAAALVLEVERLPERVPIDVALLAIASGIVQFALAYWFYLIGIKVMPVGVAGLFLTLIPVFAVSGAMIFLGESMVPLQAFGAVLILVSVVFIVGRKRSAR